MRVWIDCEWNDWQGDLISMALVTENGQEWYEVLDCTHPSPWVLEHVLPVLNKAPIPRPLFKHKLRMFLLNLGDDVEVIADWPEDVMWLCAFLVEPKGISYTPELLRFTVRSIPSRSKIPHNALEDARANMMSDLAA